MSVPEHVQTRTLHDDVIDPMHADRAESGAFRAARERIQADGHWQCWICGTTEQLELHHFLAEYEFKDIVDLDEMKVIAEALDVYGYGHLLRNRPITDPEDVRCYMTLCRPHHIGVDHADGGSGTGIHELTFSTFIIQRLAKKGLNPVPQPGETFVDVLKRLVLVGGDPHGSSSTSETV